MLHDPGKNASDTVTGNSEILPKCSTKLSTTCEAFLAMEGQGTRYPTIPSQDALDLHPTHTGIKTAETEGALTLEAQIY